MAATAVPPTLTRLLPSPATSLLRFVLCFRRAGRSWCLPRSPSGRCEQQAAGAQPCPAQLAPPSTRARTPPAAAGIGDGLSFPCSLSPNPLLRPLLVCAATGVMHASLRSVQLARPAGMQECLLWWQGRQKGRRRGHDCGSAVQLAGSERPLWQQVGSSRPGLTAPAPLRTGCVHRYFTTGITVSEGHTSGLLSPHLHAMQCTAARQLGAGVHLRCPPPQPRQQQARAAPPQPRHHTAAGAASAEQRVEGHCGAAVLLEQRHSPEGHVLAAGEGRRGKSGMDVSKQTWGERQAG